MKYKQLLLLLLFWGISHSAFCQALQFVVPDYYWNRIKNISQFMDRFSRRETPPIVDSNNIDLPYIQVASCFCIDSIQNKKEDALEFVRRMVDNNVTLDLHAPNYFCELKCKATYAGQPTIITLRLVMEQAEDSGYCWSILQAKGDVLQLIPNKTAPSMHLSPIENDMEFNNLFDIFEKHPQDIINYTHSSLSVDETSSFMALVATKQLKIKSIDDMHYVFNVKGYEFRVRCINREKNNNGWLICDFTKNGK